MLNNTLLHTKHGKNKELGADVCAVRAIIIHESKFLLIQRTITDHFGGEWEFPGGCIEQNETVLDALARELFEETGITIKNISNYLGNMEYLSRLGTGKIIREFIFVIDPLIDPAGIKLTEHDAFVWIDQKDLSTYHITEVTKSILPKLSTSSIK